MVSDESNGVNARTSIKTKKRRKMIEMRLFVFTLMQYEIFIF
ncbi:hypothetical protein B4168_0892 [Anoxybacillus flavithermus]|nr:hypothetical protein B4168_0892 [Anoxybacillus flavithermus]OAO86899.1 hypothetical protein GT23_1917 [Parageobacillus thermoglucosidasius]